MTKLLTTSPPKKDNPLDGERLFKKKKPLGHKKGRGHGTPSGRKNKRSKTRLID